MDAKAIAPTVSFPVKLPVKISVKFSVKISVKLLTRGPVKSADGLSPILADSSVLFLISSIVSPVDIVAVDVAVVDIALSVLETEAAAAAAAGDPGMVVVAMVVVEVVEKEEEDEDVDDEVSKRVLFLCRSKSSGARKTDESIS